MDSVLQLALISKAKKVFSTDKTFLSFPVSPIAFSKEMLEFFSQNDADALRQSQNNLLTFSTLVNQIPSGEAWIPKETLFLWEVYEDILKDAEFASTSRTQEEETEYQNALSYLRQAKENGGEEISQSVLAAYRKYKDLFEVANQLYLTDKNTAECSTDPDELKRWRDVDEPERRRKLDELQGYWISEGYKNEVEAAESIVARLGAKSPILTWAEWKGRFNPDIDTLTGTSDASTVFPSFFSPNNAIEDGSWMPFKLSEEEIKVLLKEAPPELLSRLGVDIASFSVKPLSMEFSSAVIRRPWFEPDAFRARFWRFSDASKIISDGNIPPKGICPAYVTAIVFVRRVMVEEKQDQAGNIVCKPMNINLDVLSTVLSNNETRHLTPLIAKETLTMNVGAIDRARSQSNLAVNRQMINASIMRGENMHATFEPYQEVPTHAARNFRSLKRSRVPDDNIPPLPSPPIPLSHPPTTQDETIYILAFICKTLPKCPDPDPTLQW
jgi:hypothetical protein